MTPFQTEIKVRRWRYWFKVRIGFNFDMLAWFYVYQDRGIDISQIKPSDLIGSMLYCSAKSWAVQSGRKVWFDYKDVSDWVDRMTTKEFEAIQKIFLESFKDINETFQVKPGDKKKV